MDSSCHCIVTIYLWLVYVFSMLLRRSKSSCVTTRRIKKILYLWLGATCSQGEGHSTGVLALEPECDLRFHDQWFSPCGQSNNHDHYFDHHHFSISPSDWRQTRAKLPSCPAASSRTLSSDLSPRSPYDQSEDRASPLFPIKSKTFSANLAPPSWSG